MSPSTDLIGEFVATMALAADDDARREAFRQGFARLRGSLDLHPRGSTPSTTFEAGARTARDVSAACLPLGIGLVMHLYPLCALRCVPLPWWSQAGRRRRHLLGHIDRQGWILANAGSERRAGAHAPVWLTRDADGIRISGTYDYVSLADVAELVLFTAPMTNRTYFCASDLSAPTVRTGPGRFEGSMQLSGTRSVTFEQHHISREQFIEVPNEAALSCMAQYQRSAFQLLLGEGYLARIEHLHDLWNLPRPTERLASVNELALLREYALVLLDRAGSPGVVESLSRVTAAMKLRISWLAQQTAVAVRGFDEVAARELGFLKLQPTSDERIVRSLLSRPCLPRSPRKFLASA